MADDLEPLPVTRLAKLSFPEKAHDWLIEDLWGAEAVGCIGGTPKAGKTWLALEMALAVASGRPCLGRYPVPRAGPVLLFCAEDGPRAVQQRVAGLAKARDVDFHRLPIGWIGASRIALDDLDHQRRLRMTVAKTKARLLVLDPLVRLHKGDENSAGDIADVAGYPKQSRLVGRIVGHTQEEVPWWRVVNASGQLRSGDPKLQAELLAEEDVICRNDRVVDAPIGRFSRGH